MGGVSHHILILAHLQICSIINPASALDMNAIGIVILGSEFVHSAAQLNEPFIKVLGEAFGKIVERFYYQKSLSG